VIAIDNSPAMLDVARGNLSQLGIDNVEVREADLTQLPLNDQFPSRLAEADSRKQSLTVALGSSSRSLGRSQRFA
jgi:Methyltransferase domain